jgi:hypothetical protein
LNREALFSDGAHFRDWQFGQRRVRVRTSSVRERVPSESEHGETIRVSEDCVEFGCTITFPGCEVFGVELDVRKELFGVLAPYGCRLGPACRVHTSGFCYRCCVFGLAWLDERAELASQGRHVVKQVRLGECGLRCGNVNVGNDERGHRQKANAGNGKPVHERAVTEQAEQIHSLDCGGGTRLHKKTVRATWATRCVLLGVSLFTENEWWSGLLGRGQFR